MCSNTAGIPVERGNGAEGNVWERKGWDKALQQLLGWGMSHHPLTSAFLHLCSTLPAEAEPPQLLPSLLGSPWFLCFPETWIAPHISQLLQCWGILSCSDLRCLPKPRSGIWAPPQGLGHSDPPVQKHLQHQTHLQHFPSVPLSKHNLKIKQLCLKLREGITVICTLLSHLTDFCLLKDTVYHQY